MNDVLREELEDLQLFADPFEVFTKSPNGDGWTAKFVRKGEEIAVRREADGAINMLRTRPASAALHTVRGRGAVSMLRGPGQRRYRNLKGLLVGEAFADLGRLASAQMHVTRGLADEATGELKEPLPNAGRIECGGGTAELTFDSVCDRLESPEARLRVFVLNGAAGVGKSHLIERIVRRRAAPASYKSGAPLLLHVESRGKVLTSLNDRIAGTLSSLRAGFVEEELKPLVRRGAVQVAIDGFDELSDSRGYARAWGALRDFIRELGGKGTCVLAGRDTMLDVDTVRAGLGPTVNDDSITLLHVEHPPAGAVRGWLSRRDSWRGRNGEMELVERQVEDVEYLGRPFFVSQIAELGPDRLQEAQGDPIADLMECIVRREGPRLTADVGFDPETASMLYRQVLSETALMMMDDETSAVDVDLVGLVIEEVFTGHADAETVKALAQRAGALALLEETAGDGGKRSFPHETVRSYFFARGVFDQFPEHGPSTGLHRVPLSADDFRIFNRVARRRPLDEQARLRERLFTELRAANGYDHLRANVGGLLLAFAPLAAAEESEEGPLELANLELGDVWMADPLGAQQVRMARCDVHRLDVRGADLRGVRFSNVLVYELIVDRYVGFGESTPEVRSVIRYEKGGTPVWVDSPSEWIERQSARSAPCGQDGSEPDGRWYLLEKFARISMRQYSLRSGQDDNDPAARKILRSPLWPSLRDLLKRYGRLEEHDTTAAGPKSEWYHLVAGAEFLDPVSDVQDSTRKILSELNVEPWKND